MNIIKHLIDSKEPANRLFFPVSPVGPFIPLIMHCQQDSLQIPFTLQESSSLLDLEFIDKLDRKKEHCSTNE